MRILLGVTGCIAAYKSCEIVRGLQGRGADVEVVMTEHALRFVGAQTFAALTGRPVACSNFGDMDDPIPHIRLAEDCDLLLIAPCTANVIAKLACGIADDLLTSTALAAHSGIVVAPAMNVHMYEAPSTQANLRTLRERGVDIIEPEEGYLACGDTGKGRLADVDDICERAISIIGKSRKKGDLCGKRILVTAGSTRERIDPVRYITNDSSGKMGIAIANDAASRGADVILIAGSLDVAPNEGIERIDVESAHDMFEAVKSRAQGTDAFIFTAAVCDVRPKTTQGHKIKKGRDMNMLRLIETEECPDILAGISAMRQDAYIVGFAAETDNVVSNAKDKLVSKGADMIVANEVGAGKTFGQDSSKAWIITEKDQIELEEMPKTRLAHLILDNVCANMSKPR